MKVNTILINFGRYLLFKIIKEVSCDSVTVEWKHYDSETKWFIIFLVMGSLKIVFNNQYKVSETKLYNENRRH